MTWEDAYKEFSKCAENATDKILANKKEIIALKKKREVFNRLMYLIKKELFARALQLMSDPATEKLFGIIKHEKY